jgi:hypothetical protein
VCVLCRGRRNTGEEAEWGYVMLQSRLPSVVLYSTVVSQSWFVLTVCGLIICLVIYHVALYIKINIPFAIKISV